jgi:hypothetical protein
MHTDDYPVQNLFYPGLSRDTHISKNARLTVVGQVIPIAKNNTKIIKI